MTFTTNSSKERPIHQHPSVNTPPVRELSVAGRCPCRDAVPGRTVRVKDGDGAEILLVHVRTKMVLTHKLVEDAPELLLTLALLMVIGPQPLCDGAHKGTEIKPLRMVADKDITLYLEFKHTSTPLVDGSNEEERGVSQGIGEQKR